MKEYLKNLFNFKKLLTRQGLEITNYTLLLTIFLFGLLQFFYRGQAPETSLYLSLGALILGIPYFISKQNQKKLGLVKEEQPEPQLPSKKLKKLKQRKK